jgi:hypothetical protein
LVQTRKTLKDYDKQDGRPFKLAAVRAKKMHALQQNGISVYLID